MKEKKCIQCEKTNLYCRNRCRRCYEVLKYREKRNLFISGPRKIAPPGSGTKNADGYILLSKKDHANAMKCGRILEHVYVMSEYLQRPIRKDERIHHKNGIRSDNRIENLELWTLSHPPGQRVEDKLKWAKEFIALYEKM